MPHSGMGDSKAEASLVTLEQSLEPNFKPPKPFDGLIKGESLPPAATGPFKVSLWEVYGVKCNPSTEKLFLPTPWRYMVCV